MHYAVYTLSCHPAATTTTTLPPKSPPKVTTTNSANPRILSCYYPPAADVARAVTEWRPSKTSESTRTVLFLHATGFHSRCWDEVVRKLDSNAHCIGIDLRGHGRSDRPAAENGMYPWLLLGEDVVTVLDSLGVDKAVGVGHSW